MRLKLISIFGLFGGLLSGCASMLPSWEADPKVRWQTYEQLSEQFAAITPYVTEIAELKQMGLHPEAEPNITVVGYADVIARFVPLGVSESGQLDAGVRDCLMAKQRCVAYKVDFLREDRKRVGNFAVDFLGFKRKVDVQGWHFTGMIVMVDGKVVYKDSGGTPTIRRHEEQTNPLGPLQGLGDSFRPSVR
ncbi:hypothetical protein [Chitinivorax sp. B]|uniref:hypothetical protein n=1 Tax=Chitinivorax sp. B TaxID=2502235 RepID=UPI0010F782A2|nr:hypothetical protein [Chitinivorax sp. B]